MGKNQTQKKSLYQRLLIKFSPVITKTKSFLAKFKIAILISLVGGVPGIINIWNWAHSRPTFIFHTETFANGIFHTGDGIPYKYYLISGAIYNSGTEPLFPYTFDLEVKYKDTLILSQSLPIDSTVMKAPKYPYVFKNDLSSVVRVSSLDASFGTIIFPVQFTNYDLGDLDNIIYMKMTCTDILRRKMVFKLDVEALRKAGDRGLYYPKTGVKTY